MHQTNSFDRASYRIPRWHFEMLHDFARNAAIEAAIASSDVGGKIVVEIGTGAGLPALLFAKYGAKKVFTCEVNEQIANVARKIIQKNNFQDRIAVISKSSRQAIVDSDLPSAPDIIFTETLDCGVVGEGYETIARDVRQIAGPCTIVMPDRIQQFGFLCADETAFERNCVFNQCGFDFSMFNTFSEKSYFPVNQMVHDPIRISSLILLKRFDYMNPSTSDVVDHKILICRSGLCHGITSYFDAYFGKFLVTSRGLTSHWAAAFHPLREPMLVESGQYYNLRVDKTGLIELISI
ncbi:protein arginine N-methyltransferase 1 [Paraburkholderia sp. WC7.3g]|uniref:50S ribosomal protein L11 methyltransferase n=1 Tax=Paraburkholderia sp. WC7.3g TaxID=2991070 RepID=UPI003D1A9003